MESLKRMREPAAFAVLIVLWLQLAADLIWFFTYGRDSGGSLAAVALGMSNRVLENLTIVVLAVLVASCVLADRTRHARVLTALALIGTLLMILAALILGAVGLAAESATKVRDGLELLLAAVVPAIAVAGLVRLLRISSAQAAASELQATGPSDAVDASTAEAAQPVLPNPRQEPVWEPDAASGVAWHTAGDAAVGAPAAGWGTPGEAGGWNPIPGEADEAETTRTSGDS
jgi:predicted membrane protein